jgi:hypothetical protein
LNELDARAILGVSDTATFKEIKTAYRSLVRVYHPDRAGSDAEAQAKATQVMGRINEAWATIEARENAGQLGSKDYSSSSRNESASWSVSRRRPNSNECELCGSTPAQKYSLKGNRVFITSLQRIGYDGVLCKSCALAFGREALRQTMLFGWWGIWFFLSPFVIIYLGIQLFQVNRMTEPQYRDSRVMTPFDVPMASQPSPLKQPGPLIVSGLAIAVILAFMFSSPSPSSDYSNVDVPASTHTKFCWTQGDASGNVQNVDCADSSAYYREVVKVADPSQCPSTAPIYLAADAQGQYMCLGYK